MLIVKSTVGKIVLMTSKMHFGSFGLCYSFQNLSNRFHFQTALFCINCFAAKNVNINDNSLQNTCTG